ncbi:pectinesterase family protein [Nocardiopsis aegyptia]|uniref:Pectinesterase n=1 Tax=Nocardiopsis aegyptia TaxID=220378 RepID=A0A7Z0J8H1_9ACTN|nr:pectinesterase family protein [Nocardiopsis aegyptia]NYJ33108.1 pectin methylesterase-like acyl-CoA thioesterase [Nocardiopsis aegyptia]
MRTSPTTALRLAALPLALAGVLGASAIATASTTTAPSTTAAVTTATSTSTTTSTAREATVSTDDSAPVITVEADGSGDFSSVQEAVDAAHAGTTVRIGAGVYREPVVVATSDLTLVGATGDPRDVVITYDRASGLPKPGGGTWGTSGSASVVISGDDVHTRDLTFENSFLREEHPEVTSTQAVAVRTTGDRLVFDNVRFLGHQDTLYANSPNTESTSRQYYRNCYVEGDVDFVFGRGTAVFHGCEIRSLDRGSDSDNGYVTAPSTPPEQEFGFLFTESCFTSDAPAESVYLGRPWVPSSAPDARPQALIRDSWMGRHFKEQGWIEMSSGHDWRQFQLREFDNHGPGALTTPDRPQMSAEEAAGHTAEAYLAGADGWNPVREPARPVCTARGR